MNTGKTEYYDKIHSGGGYHYEEKHIIYYTLKFLTNETRFRLSNSRRGEVKLDDVILETDEYVLYVQSKFCNIQEQIPDHYIFGSNENYSIFVYSYAFYESIYKPFLKKLQDYFKQLSDNTQEGSSTDKNEELLVTLNEELSNKINNNCEQSFETLVLNLKKLNNDKVNALLTSFENNTFRLVTNVPPNRELKKFCELLSFDSLSLPCIEESWKIYSFNTSESIEKISCSVIPISIKKKQEFEIPKTVMEMFLKKFVLITILDDTIEKNVYDLLSPICENLGVCQRYFSNHISKEITRWRTYARGIYINKEVVEQFFSSAVSSIFKEELEDNKNILKFNLDPFWKTIKEGSVTIIKTSKYLPIIKALQEKFLEEKIKKTIFVNPRLKPDVRKQLISFKCSYLICYPVGEDEIVLREIQKEGNSGTNKKLILFYDKTIKIPHQNNTSVFEVNDGACGLKIIENPDLIDVSIENSYIDRKLYQNALITEEKFIRIFMKSKENFFVISGKPGTGKTMFLANLLEKFNKQDENYAIFIGLSQFKHLFEEHRLSKTVPQIEEFLSIPDRGSSKRQINNFPTILIFDAFSELHQISYFKDIVTTFLQNVRVLKKYKIIVATREQDAAYLQQQCDVEPYSLEKFNIPDVCSLICRVQKQDIEHTQNIFSSIPNEFHQIFSLPFYAKIFAEEVGICQRLSRSDECINWYRLYETFLEKQTDIFVRKRLVLQEDAFTDDQLSAQNRYELEKCQSIALGKYFDRTTLSNIGISYCSGKDNKLLEWERYPHQTFLDFFVAKWIIENVFCTFSYKSKFILEEIFSRIIFKEKNVIHQFLEDYLRENWHSISIIVFENVGNITSSFLHARETYFKTLNYKRFPNLCKLILNKSNMENIRGIYEKVVMNEDCYLNSDFVSFLLTRGADINYKRGLGESILHIAVTQKNLLLVKYLCYNTMIDINEKDVKNLTPVHHAVIENNYGIFDLLLKKDVNLNYIMNWPVPIEFNDILPKNLYSKLNVLHFAIAYGFTSFFKSAFNDYKHIFLDPHANVDYLQFAALSGNIELVKFLANKNIYAIREKNIDGWNFLHFAVYGGKVHVVKFLEKYKIDINAKTEKGVNLLHLAVISQQLDMVKYVVNLKIDIGEETNEGYTACDFANRLKNKEILQFLEWLEI